MENVSLVGTPVESVVGEFEFPDGKKRLATKRTKVDKIGESHLEYVEHTNLPSAYEGKLAMTGKMFLVILKNVLALVSEFKMTFDSGINIKVVDPAHVAMANMSIPKESFMEYDMPPKVDVCMNADRLHELKVKVKDTVYIRMKFALKEKKAVDGGDTYITFNYECESFVLQFGVVTRSMMPVDSDLVSIPKMPPINADNYVVLKTSYVHEAVNQCAKLSDAAKFELFEDRFEVSSRGQFDASNKEEVALNKFERDQIKDMHLVETSVHSLYPIEYIAKTFGASLSSEDVKISFKTDYPMKAEFRMNVDAFEPISMVYYLAPRME